VHQEIFAAIQKFIGKGRVADAVTLARYFASNDHLGEVGGAGYLAQLVTAMVGINTAPEYGRVIHECWQRRQAIEAAESLYESAFDATQDLVGIALKSLSVLDGLATGISNHRPVISLDEAIDEALAQADLAAARGGVIGYSTGMPVVDRVIRGLCGGCLYILAGRPGDGKSTLGFQWAINRAKAAAEEISRGEPAAGVLVASLEMDGAQLGMRALSVETGIPLERLQFGKHKPYIDDLSNARARLRGLPLTIADEPAQTVAQIMVKARAAKRKHGLSLIMVDHLHIVTPESKDAKLGTTFLVGQISRGLKNMSKALGVPVLALAQMNRKIEDREDKRPNMGDLRYSGDVEQDADVVMFIYREAVHWLRQKPNRAASDSDDSFKKKMDEWEAHWRDIEHKALLICDKVRAGKPDTVELKFFGETTSFSDLGAIEPMPAVNGAMAGLWG
jgi:replicative DNA helicase